MPRKITRYCKACNGEYFGCKSKVYCSEECRNSIYRPSWKKGLKGMPGKAHNGADKTCEVCSKQFYVPKTRLDAKYCSYKCYYEGRWGGSHTETRHCVICEKPFDVTRSSMNVTCSDRCSREHKSREHQGEKSTFWRGGKMAPYVGEWRAQRRAARERDGYKCVLCSSTDRIQVHHIIPYRYSQSHELDNLVTLCRPCHSREELKVNAHYVKALQSGYRRFHARRNQSDN